MTENVGSILNHQNSISILDVYNDPFIKFHISQRSLLQKPVINNAKELPQTQMFKNFSAEGNNKNSSPQKSF